MKQLFQLLAAMTLAAGVIAFVAAPIPEVGAACSGAECALDATEKVDTGGSSTSLDGAIKTIVNILLFLIGAAAVIMIVIGGIKYTTSNGNAEQTKSAKNTILYAIIGLIVAIMAYALVDFVVEAFV